MPKWIPLITDSHELSLPVPCLARTCHDKSVSELSVALAWLSLSDSATELHPVLHSELLSYSHPLAVTTHGRQCAGTHRNHLKLLSPPRRASQQLSCPQ